MWVVRYGKSDLSTFDKIARPLEDARTQNCDKSISYGI